MKKLLMIGLLAQATMGLTSIIRIPIVVSSLGVEGFAGYASALGCWVLASALGEGLRVHSRRETAANGLANLKPGLAYRQALPLILISTIFAIGVVATVNLTYRIVDAWVLILVLVASFLYPLSGSFVGAYEGMKNFTWLHKSLIIGQLLSFVATIATSYLHSQLALVASVVLPSFLSGIYAYVKIRELRNCEVDPNQDGYKRDSDNKKFIAIALFENLAYSLDTTIVLSIAGPVKATVFNLMQRLAVLYSIVPMILSPKLAVESASRFDPKITLKYQKQQAFIAALASIPLVLCSPWVYAVISSGEVKADLLVCAMAAVNGVVGSWISPLTQSMIQKDILKFRVSISFGYAGLSTALTFLCVAVIGPAGAFFATALALSCYVLAMWVIYRQRRRA